MVRPKTILLAALALCVGVGFLGPSINPYFLDVAIGVGINIILAVSLNLINGYTGQFSLGHAGYMSVGAYTAAMLTTTVGKSFLNALGGADNPLATPILFVLALLAGGLAAALTGWLIGVPSLRLRGDYLAIVTLGFGEIIRIVFQNMELVGGALGLKGIPPYTTLGWTFGVAAITIYAVVALVNSTYGRGFIAVHDDEIASEAIGIDTTRYKVTAFVVGAFFAGVAGGLYGHFKQFISPDGFGFMRSIEIVVMVILGGMGNTIGVIIAAVLLTLLPEVLRVVPEVRMIVYSLLLVVMMIVAPKGLFNMTWWRGISNRLRPNRNRAS